MSVRPRPLPCLCPTWGGAGPTFRLSGRPRSSTIQRCRQGIHALRPTPSRHTVTRQTLALRDGRISTSAQPRKAIAIFAVPGTPAIWSAFGGPASHHRRGRVEATWRTATTPMARRRPVSLPGKPHRNALPRGLPGSAIVWSPPRCRMVVPAQWRARHAPVWRHMPACSGVAPARPGGGHMPARSGAVAARPGERCFRRARVGFRLWVRPRYIVDIDSGDDHR